MLQSSYSPYSMLFHLGSPFKVCAALLGLSGHF